MEFANPEPEVAAPSESRTTTPKRARQDDVVPPQESATTGEFSSSASGNDVEMGSISTGKRPLEPGGDDDIVCGLDVCDELHEYSADTYVNDCKGDYTDEVTGVTLLDQSADGRDGVVRIARRPRRRDGRDMPVKNKTPTHLL